MIDLHEAERIARNYLNEHGRAVISSTTERTFGWVFFCKAPAGSIPGGMNIAVARQTAKLSNLGSAFPLETTIGWLEEDLQWQAMHNSALNQASLADFAKAESTLLESMYFAEELARQRPGNLADQARIDMTIASMNSLASIYMQKGELERAESTFLQAKSLFDELVPLKRSGSAEQRAPLLANLIDFYIQRRRRFDADMIKRELALAYYMDWKFSKAQEIFEEQLQKRSEIYPDNHPRLAQTLADLATLKSAQQQYFEAGMFFERSMQIWDWLWQSQQRLSEFAEKTDNTSVSTFQQMFVETLDAYSRFLSQRPGKSEEAATVKKRAAELKQLLI